MKTHETTRQKTKCIHCEKSFFDISNLEQHCKDYHPDLSRDWLTNTSNIKWKPVEQVHADMPTCERCNKSFARKENLKLHMKSHHTLERRIFNCAHCSKPFHMESSLNRHVRKYHSK